LNAQIQNFEAERSSLFDKTADVRAENQLGYVVGFFRWVIIATSKMTPKDEDFVPVFGRRKLSMTGWLSYDDFL
jgi:hypothetical protein